MFQEVGKEKSKLPKLNVVICKGGGKRGKQNKTKQPDNDARNVHITVM